MKLELQSLRELLVGFALSAAFLFFMGTVGILLQALAGAGDVPLVAAVELVPISLLVLSEVLTPLAFLISVLFAYGRMSAENEYLALEACGVHPLRAVAPALAIGLAIACAQFQIASVTIPELVLRQDRILTSVGLQTFRNLPPGASHFTRGDFSLHWKRRDGDVLHDVLIQYKGSDPESPRLDGVAKRVRVVGDGDRLGIVLEEFQSFHGGNSFTLEEQTFYVTGSPEGARSALLGKPKFLSTDALVALSLRARTAAAWEKARGTETSLAQARWWKQVSSRYAYEAHGRVARSLCAFAFALVGAPIAIWLRRGTRLAALLVAGGIVFLGYYPLARIGEGLEATGRLPAWLCAWSGTLGVGMAGLALTYRLVRR